VRIPLPLCMPIDLPAFFALFTPMFLHPCFYAHVFTPKQLSFQNIRPKKVREVTYKFETELEAEFETEFTMEFAMRNDI
jgi:hypothetical protein